jgi:uncharacterized protein (DUF983 family)
LGEPYYPPISPIGTGLRCRCPRCGEGRLYAGLLTVRPLCERCGLDFAAVDSGDGPAVFVILILGFLVVGAALWVEIAFEPPIWVHMVLWLPTILVASIALLRPFKAVLIALQYHHKVVAGFG